MRISWIEPRMAHRIREVLMAWNRDVHAHFGPEFLPPPCPADIDETRWRKLAEHVARAERVAQVIRERGLDAASARFSGSGHAIEQAVLIRASISASASASAGASASASAGASGEVQAVPESWLFAALYCPMDDLVVYGPILQLLETLAGIARERALAAYQAFCDASMAFVSDEPTWDERVRAARDGLACFYVRCGRFDTAHELFAQRYREQPDSLLMALSASRAFLSAGATDQAVAWLGLGAERALALGRPAMADKLREKKARLQSRL